MKKLAAWISCGLLLVSALPVAADVLRVVPSQAVVLPADDSGTVRVALQFDLGALSAGTGRRIDAATIDWNPGGIPTGEMTSYGVYAVASAWNAGMGQPALRGVEIETAPADLSDISPADIARTGEARIRLEITELVAAWMSGKSANHGVVVTAVGVDGRVFVESIANVTLTILYGFNQE